MSRISSRRRASAAAPSPAATITAAILARLEAGVKPWVRPWRCATSSRPLRACGTPYRGINVFWLWLVADTHGYRSPHWMTYRQAKVLGGQVRKGEHASIAVFYKSYVPRDGEGGGSGERGSSGSQNPGGAGRDNEDDRCRMRRVLKSYAVFNADQVDGLPERFVPVAEDAAPQVEPAGREGALDAFFARVPAELRHHGDQAYYEPMIDRVTMPPPLLFRGYVHYYATLAHELSHWTGHGSRLARDLKHRFGTAAYAAEELVAELSAAMLGAELGLPVEHLDHHASYVGHWLELLRFDDRAILTAAARAEEASELLLRLGGRGPADGPDDVEGGGDGGDPGDNVGGAGEDGDGADE